MTVGHGYVPLTVADGIRASLHHGAGRVALREADRSLTYGRLVERIDRIGNAAHGLGLRRGDHVALMAPNCLEFVEIVCGLAAVGVAVAMISPRATAAEVGEICGDCEARMLMVHPDTAEVAHAADLSGVESVVEIGEPYEALLSRASTAAPSVDIDESDIFCIPYTSGTTGRAKGVLLPHRARAWTFFAMAVEFGCFGPGRRALAATGLNYGAGFSFAVAPLFFGGTTIILGRFEPDAMLRLIESERVTSAFTVPTQLNDVLSLGESERARHRTCSLQALISNAAPLSQPAKERLVQWLGDDTLFEAYGSTEGGWISAIHPRDQLTKPGSVGHPLPCTRVRIVDADGDEVPVGETGELLVRSPFMFSGYWRREAETAAAFRDGWFATGDVARFDDDGYLYLVDRMNDLIISGGVNVYPREVEDALLRHVSVAEVAVFGIPDERWGEAVHATVALRPGAQASERELLDHCSKLLAGPKRPKAIDFAPSLPHNSAGKVLRRELRQPFWEARDRLVS